MKNQKFGTYWTETETYESLKMYIDMDLDGLKQAIITMLGGEYCPIDIRTFQNDMTSITSKDDVLTLLVHLGYLAYEAVTKSVYIPNEEIRQEFIRAVKHGKHQEMAELIAASDKLLQDTLAITKTLRMKSKKGFSAGWLQYMGTSTKRESMAVDSETSTIFIGGNKTSP